MDSIELTRHSQEKAASKISRESQMSCTPGTARHSPTILVEVDLSHHKHCQYGNVVGLCKYVYGKERKSTIAPLECPAPTQSASIAVPRETKAANLRIVLNIQDAPSIVSGLRVI